MGSEGRAWRGQWREALAASRLWRIIEPREAVKRVNAGQELLRWTYQ